MKIFDVQPPKNTWERAYIKFEYERMGLNQVGDTIILVKDDDSWRDTQDEREEFIDHQLEEHNTGDFYER